MIFKRILLFLLTVILATSLFSCEEYKEGLRFEGESVTEPAPTPGGEMDADPTNDFTVTLYLNGKPYKPLVGLDVYWSDGYDVYVAPVDENGVARIDGLDGDYHVTLSSVPYGCAYDSNSYVATNINRNIILDLYDLNPVSGKGSGLYSCYQLGETGIYSVTVSEPGEMAYFEFAPQMNGTYTVESWASITEDEVNPIAIAYYGSSSYKHSPYTVDDVSTVGSFTRNFLHTVKIADQMISGGGSQTFTFALTAETKSGVYPVTFTFAIKRDGGFDLDLTERSMIPVRADMSHFDFDAFNSLAGGKIVGAETLFKDKDGNEKEGAYVFDENEYKLWRTEDGGDGVYHVYNKEKYPETNGYGPVLVAYITSPCRFLDQPLTAIEYFGNKALTVNGGTENYKHFIEGYGALVQNNYYCIPECKCMEKAGHTGACTPECTDCHANCNRCPEDMIGKEGYNAWCNADGVAPVTEELADFLQKFAIAQRYFADGDGWAERRGIYAYEESQWLFCCGYYK
ncbi:MAG: hypothetical protein E7611_08220 [Ruminococcaceae bacterium]|nr:hypothetical protein [Oscillospiraceae bacterium]